MSESFRIPQELDFVSVPKSLIMDSSISPGARFLFATVMSLGSGCSKADVVSALGVSDFRYRGMVRELEDAGYIKRSQSNENGRFGSVSFELCMPSSEPHVKNLCTVPEDEQQNPSSEPHVKNLCTVPITKRNNSNLNEMISKGKEHVLKNLTEEEYDSVFRLVCSACREKRWLPQQRDICRPLADAVFGGGLDFKAAMQALSGMVNDGLHNSRLPSYWFSDYGGEVSVWAGALSQTMPSMRERTPQTAYVTYIS